MSIPFQRSTDSNGPDCVFQLDTITIGLRTIEESRPSDSSTAACDYACDLSHRDGIYIYIYTCKLTTKSSLCLLYTPLSSSGSRHCPHSNVVFSASIQSSQNSRRCRRWAWEGSCTAPRPCPTSSVLHLVPRDVHISLGSGPGHPQR